MTPAAEQRGYYRVWVAVGVLALAWHAFWFVWLSPEPVEASQEQTQPMAFTFVAEKAGADAGVMRGMWSAGLFSLPSASGFSKPLLASHVGARPPLASPVDAATYLPRTRRGRRTADALGGVELKGGVAQALTVLDPSPHRFDVFADHTSTSSFLMVECQAGIAERDLDIIELPPVSVFTNDAPLDFVVNISFDAQGVVEHALLESGCDDPRLNALVIRSLYQWRSTLSRDGVRGQVRLSYIPATTLAKGGLPPLQ